jgi:Lon protease-like protein
VTTQAITGLPLFPLGTVLFPQGLLPLQIFEVRYLHMVANCRRDGSGFGVVSLMQGSEVEKAGQPHAAQFQPLGTLARIIDFEAPMPGLMRIQCIGEQRFRIRRHERLSHGLWVADVDCIEPDQAVAIPDDLLHVAQKLGRLIKTLQSRGVSNEDMPMRAPYELDDCSWVANRWSELLPLSPSRKQDLLALESPVLRLELISDILDRTTLSF